MLTKDVCTLGAPAQFSGFAFVISVEGTATVTVEVVFQLRKIDCSNCKWGLVLLQ